MHWTTPVLLGLCKTLDLIQIQNPKIEGLLINDQQKYKYKMSENKKYNNIDHKRGIRAEKK
jgi:hypothetical protein